MFVALDSYVSGWCPVLWGNRLSACLVCQCSFACGHSTWSCFEQQLCALEQPCEGAHMLRTAYAEQCLKLVPALQVHSPPSTCTGRAHTYESVRTQYCSSRPVRRSLFEAPEAAVLAEVALCAAGLVVLLGVRVFKLDTLQHNTHKPARHAAASKEGSNQQLRLDRSSSCQQAQAGPACSQLWPDLLGNRRQRAQAHLDRGEGQAGAEPADTCCSGAAQHAAPALYTRQASSVSTCHRSRAGQHRSADAQR